jgi:hypothetical protein
MSNERANQLIVISLFVLLASTVGSKLAESKKGQEKHYGRKIVGGFLTMFFASLMAEAAPEVGALLAISIASYAFLTDGLPAINKPLEKQQGKNLEQAIKEKGGTVFPPVTNGPATASPTNLGPEFI